MNQNVATQQERRITQRKNSPSNLRVYCPQLDISRCQPVNLSTRGAFLDLIPSNPFASFASGNVLQVIIFAVFLAIAITFTKEKGQPLLKVLESVANTMHTLTHFVMMAAPYGIFALIASTVGSVGLKVIFPLFKLTFSDLGLCHKFGNSFLLQASEQPGPDLPGFFVIAYPILLLFAFFV